MIATTSTTRTARHVAGGAHAQEASGCVDHDRARDLPTDDLARATRVSRALDLRRIRIPAIER